VRGGGFSKYIHPAENLLRSVVDTRLRNRLRNVSDFFFMYTMRCIHRWLELVARKDTSVSITQVLVASISHQYLMQYSRLRLKLLMLHSSFIMPFYETKVARMPLELKKRFSKTIRTPESCTGVQSTFERNFQERKREIERKREQLTC